MRHNPDSDIPCKISEFAETFRQHDQLVIHTNLPLKILEIHPAVNNEWTVVLNNKMPLHDNKENIIGTFSYCIDLTKQLNNIINSLSILNIYSQNKKNLTQNSYLLDENHFDIKLTPRQADCLFYFIRGKTSKEIAAILKLSTRTIEKFLAQLKEKFSCNSKSMLIDIAIQKGFMNYIPKHIFENSLLPRTTILV